MGCNDEAWAVFWCSLLSPLLLEEIPHGKRERYFHQLSREERLLPDGKRRRLSVRTLRRKWQQLKKDGVLGLYRRRRSDRPCRTARRFRRRRRRWRRACRLPPVRTPPA